MDELSVDFEDIIFSLEDDSTQELISEVRQIKEFQIQGIENSIEFLKISVVFMGFLLAFLIGAYFIKLSFK